MNKRELTKEEAKELERPLEQVENIHLETREESEKRHQKMIKILGDEDGT